MKTLMNTRFLLLFIALISLSACSDDDDDNMMVDPPDKPVTPARTTVYNLGSSNEANISGTATFIENPDNTVTIDLKLVNTQTGGVHPAHIHANTAAEDGPILLTLGVVDGSTGQSSVTIGALDDGTVVNYDTLITLDGSINIHLDDEEELFWIIVSQGDIGVNALTGVSKSYDLNEKMVPGIDGKITFYERLNGEALSVIELNNTPENGVHPAHIHNNSAAIGGSIAFSFNPIDGTSGVSRTNVATLDDGSSFGYDDVVIFDGYINVHLSVDDLATIVAQGNIGASVDDGSGEEAITYTVSNTGSSAYVFNGNSLENVTNPEISLKRGMTYEFVINAPGHPFYLKTTQSIGTSDTFDAGVTNNGASGESITFTVPADAPDTLYYICEFHSLMTGTFIIVD